MGPKDLARLERDLPAAAAQVARELRSGSTLLEALDRTARSGDGPLADDLGRVVAAVRRGVPLAVVLDGWRRVRRSESVALFVVAARFVHLHGGRCAPALEGVATALVDRAEVAAEQRALTAQARLSAGVLAALPVVGLAGFTLLDPSVATVLLTTPAGWCCLVAGTLLESSGVAVLRRQVRAVVP